jgi:hypothetical protein
MKLSVVGLATNRPWELLEAELTPGECPLNYTMVLSRPPKSLGERVSLSCAGDSAPSKEILAVPPIGDMINGFRCCWLGRCLSKWNRSTCATTNRRKIGDGI